MAEKYEKVLKLMQSKPDGIIRKDDKQLVELLGEKLASYRIPMYMSNIRKKANLDIKGIREKRKVVAYQLVATATATPEPTPEPPPAAEPAPSSPEPTSEDLGSAQLPPVDSTPDEPAVSDGWSI